MKLYCFDTSPFSRKVILASHVLGVSCEHVKENPYQSSPALLAANPSSKVPVLKLFSGERIIGSERICAYLNRQFGGKLFGERLPRGERLGKMGGSLFFSALDGEVEIDDPDCSIRRREQLMELANTAIESVITIALELKREPARQDAAIVERHQVKIERIMSSLCNSLGDFFDEELKMPEITLICLLGYLDLRLESFDWRTKFSSISDWYEHITGCNPFVLESDHKVLVARQ